MSDSAKSRDSDPMVGRTLGDFVVEERIGEGSFGAVYRARQPALGRLAAIKLLHRRLTATAEATERFLREAQTASSLDHPYAAHIYASGAEPDGTLWVAMEYVRGSPFSEYLRENGTLSLERFVPFLERVCEVVHSAHEEGIVHRDIKPENIMVMWRSGRLLPKLLDFGVAKAIAATEEDAVDGAGSEEHEGADEPRERPGLAETAPPASAPANASSADPSETRSKAPAKRVGQGIEGAPVERTSNVEIAGTAQRPSPGAAQRESGGAESEPSERKSNVELAGTAQGTLGDDGRHAADRVSATAEIAPSEHNSDVELAGTAAGSGELAYAGEARRAGRGPAIGTPAPAGKTPAGSGRGRGESRSGNVTQRGQLVGSPYYMAPEQWDDAAAVDARSDIYALGVLAYEALTGERPFTGKSLPEVAKAHEEKPIPDVSEGLPRELNDVFASALAKRPDDRFEDALTLSDRFRRASGIREVSKPLPQIDEALRRRFEEGAPGPIARAVATLGAAVEPRQARDVLWSTAEVLAHYLGLLALASYSRFRGETSGKAAEILRRAGKETLGTEDWLALGEALCAPYATRPELHPLPDLAAFLTADRAEPVGATEPAGEHASFRALWNLREPMSSAAASEDALFSALEEAISLLSALLERVSFVCETSLVLAKREDPCKPLDGIVQQHALARPVGSTGAQLRENEVYLLDADGAPALCLSPLVQMLSPAPEAPAELFFLAGASGRGGKLIAPLFGFERHDAEVLEWLRAQVGQALGARRGTAETERPPYLGLEAFTTNDADLFVGREKEIDTFVNRLRTEPLLAAVGPSGAGKSSFIQAGVIPALQERQPNLRALVLRPGATPITTLAARVVGAGYSAYDLEERLRDDPEVLGELLREGAQERGEIVLIVDQFEELFTLTRNDEERERFARALSSAARSAADPVRVILSLRDDFLVKAESLVPFKARLGHSLLLLTTPGALELERIVKEPARRAGYDFEDADLPARMVAEVEGEPGALALLSFTATKLWEASDRHFQRLPAAAYEDMGGVAGALSHHADALLDAMPASERRHVREAFRLLVTSEGTRAVLGRQELVNALGESDEAQAAIEHLVRGRLLVVSETEDGEQIEIAHEALLSTWPRLVEWQREDAEGARLRDQLRAAAVQWDRRGRPKGLLWHGDALAEYRLWRARYPGALTQVEEDFGRASLAEAKKTRRRRQGFTASAFGILAACAAALFVMAQRADDARQEAEMQRTVAEDREDEMAEQLLERYLDQGSEALQNHDYHRALAYLFEAREMGAEGPEVDVLFSMAAAPFEAHLATYKHEGQMWRARYSPDGARLAVTTSTGHVYIRDGEDGSLEHKRRAHDGQAFQVAWAPQSDRLATAGWDGTARVFNAETGDELHVLDHDGEHVYSITFDESGERILTGSGEGLVRIFRHGETEAKIEAHRGIAWTIASRPGGDEFVTGGDGGRVRVWDVATGEHRADLPSHEDQVEHATFSPKGDALLTTSWSGRAHIYDPDERVLRTQLVGHRARILWGEFDETGDRVATAGRDGTARIWDSESGRELATVKGHEGFVSTARFSGNEVLTSGADGIARRWDAKRGGLRASLPTGVTPAGDALYHPEGSHIAVATRDGFLTFWEMDSGSHRVLEERDDRVTTARYSADGKYILTTGAHGPVRLWDANTGEIERATHHPELLVGADLGPRAEIVAALGVSGTVRVWEEDFDDEPAKLGESSFGLGAVRMGPKGERVARISQGVTLWDLDTKDRIVEIDSRDTEYVDGQFTPDGDALLAAGWDGTVRLYDLDTGETIRTFEGHTDRLFTMPISPGGERIATTSRDSTVRLWDLQSGKELDVLTGHAGWTTDADFSADGALLATAGADRTARIWGTQSGRELARFVGHRDLVHSVSFAPSGDALVTASHDGTARIWDIPREPWTAEALEGLVRCIPVELRDGAPVPIAELPEDC